MSKYIVVWDDLDEEKYKVIKDKLMLCKFNAAINDKIAHFKNHEFFKNCTPKNVRVFEIAKEITEDCIK